MWCNSDFMEYTDKQVQIIDTAQDLFAENGYDGTSIRDIAKAAGINVAMVSYYFGSKEGLLEAIFSRHAEYVRLKLENLIQDKSQSPFQKMEVIIDSYIDKYFSQQPFHKLVARSQLSNSNKPVKDMLNDMKKRNQDLIKRLIQEGQKTGEFKKNIDVQMLMSTMLGTANQVMTTQDFYREVNNMTDLPDEEFLKILKKKLRAHLQALFKAILKNED